MARNAHHPSSNPSSPSPAASNGTGPIAQQLLQLQVQHAPHANTQHATKSASPTTNAPLASNGHHKKRRASAKEVREWLNLVGIYTIVNNTQQATIAQQNRQADVSNAQQNRQADISNQLDQQRETTLKTYEDDMSSLLLAVAVATFIVSLVMLFVMLLAH